MMWKVYREGEVVSRQAQVSGAVISALAKEKWSGPVVVEGPDGKEECRKVGGVSGDEETGLYGAVVRASRECSQFHIVADGLRYMVREEEM